ncbi:MAG TPA: hypothetical protein VHM19_18935 [Polyangiales bacterium]|nr:hypothetical protein [Polyangiales bacterium]
MAQHTTDGILYALFCLSRDTRHIDAGELGRAVGVSTTEAARALIALERAGLVDASRARLTMPGLARAAALQAGGAGGRGTPAVDLRGAKPRKSAAQLPVAARSVVPPASEERDQEPAYYPIPAHLDPTLS